MMLEVRLVLVMPHIETSYYICNSIHNTVGIMKRVTNPMTPIFQCTFPDRKRPGQYSNISRFTSEEHDNRLEFVNAIAFSSRQAVIVVGRSSLSTDGVPIQ